MEKVTILVIEDDKDLRKIIEEFLKKEGYHVICASDGEEGIQLAKSCNPTLILLDLMLPKVDGYEVCRDIRTRSVAPIVIISAKNSDMDKMLSLGIGADDYLTKPFSLLELAARIKSHIRRYVSFSKPAIEDDPIIHMGEVMIDSKSMTVTVCGKRIDMTPKEFHLLEFLAKHPSQVFKKEQLLDYVWGESEFIDLNTITVYVGRIREKMTQAGACYIKTVWGEGYKWEM